MFDKIRQHRTRVLAAAAVLVAAVVASTPAGASQLMSHRFTGSATAEVRALGAGEEEFRFSPFSITCKRARSQTESLRTSFPSATVYLAVQFSKCVTAPLTIGKVKLSEAKATFTKPIDLVYHADRYAELGVGSHSTTEIEGAGALEIEPGDGSGCVISWTPQTVPAQAVKEPSLEYEAALYEKVEEKTENHKSFPTGVHDKLLIKSSFIKMSYTVAGGDCTEQAKSEGKTGAYTGALLTQLVKGQLGWE